MVLISKRVLRHPPRIVSANDPSHPPSRFTFHLVLLHVFVYFLRALITVFNARKAAQAYAALPSGVKRKRIDIASREKGRNITVDVYHAEALEGAVEEVKNEESKQRVHVTFHGSAYVIPGLGLDHFFCSSLVLSTPNLIILDADYRKSPSAPFPLATQDALDVLSYARAQFPRASLSVGGFSAGGNLALGSALELGPEVVDKLVLCYANVDCRKESMGAAGPKGSKMGAWVLKGFMNICYSCYLRDPSDPEKEIDRYDWRVSPTLGPLEKFPRKVLVAVGEADGMWDENRTLAERLWKGGRGKEDVKWVTVENEGHAFDLDPHTKVSKERRRKLYDAISRFLLE